MGFSLWDFLLLYRSYDWLTCLEVGVSSLQHRHEQFPKRRLVCVLTVVEHRVQTTQQYSHKPSQTQTCAICLQYLEGGIISGRQQRDNPRCDLRSSRNSRIVEWQFVTRRFGTTY